MSDPFDALSPGLHVTDGGRRYQVSEDLADLDFLVGGSLDVVGQFFVSMGDVPRGGHRLGWPGIVVELNLQALQVGAGDLLPAALGTRGLTPVPHLRQPPQVERIEWTVRLHPRGKHPSGVYGPGHGRRPGGWALITPAPPARPRLWTQLVRGHTGGQCGVYLTTHTFGLVTTRDPAAWEAAFAAEAAAGRLFGTRAAVLA